MHGTNINAIATFCALVESGTLFGMTWIDLHFANGIATSAMNAILLDALMLVHYWLKGLIPCYTQQAHQSAQRTNFGTPLLEEDKLDRKNQRKHYQRPCDIAA